MIEKDFYISIVVPVYNVEQYIDKCVESIMKQTYTFFELILVDDGSPDRCPAICDAYAQKYKNVIVLHKKNGGLSDARNYGVEHANGEYVTFIDSDDYVSEDYLETLVELKKKYCADICVGGLNTFYEGNVPKIQKKPVKEKALSGLEALKQMLYQSGLDSSACALLLPKNITQEFCFPVGKYHEDEFTTYKYYANVEKVAITSKSIYYYLQRKNSIMHTFGQTSIDELEAADNYVEECKENWPTHVKAAETKKFSDYCQVYLSIDDLEKIEPKMYETIGVYMSDKKKQILFDRNARKKNRFAALILMFGPSTLRFVNRIISKR